MIGEELPVSFKVNKEKNAVSFEIPLDIYKQYFKDHVDNDFYVIPLVCVKKTAIIKVLLFGLKA